MSSIPRNCLSFNACALLYASDALPELGGRRQPMTVTNWIRWNRTELEPAEREALLGALTPAQQRSLLHHDYTWMGRSGVLWLSPTGSLRRARFTHGAQFETKRGAFRMDAEGSVREEIARPEPRRIGASR
jgi:hypothetical protein